MSGSDQLYLQGEDRIYLNSSEGKTGGLTCHLPPVTCHMPLIT